MTKIKSFKDLIVWQRALELCKEVYTLTKNFPKDEQFGLISQMRRATISIVSNIAEGSGRYFINEWKQFYSFAYGSALEFEAQLLLSIELNFTSKENSKKAFDLLEEVSKMLLTILKNLRQKQEIAS